MQNSELRPLRLNAFQMLALRLAHRGPVRFRLAPICPERPGELGTTVFFYDKNGRFHRDKGPAVLHANGSREYYRHGLLHNENGPARLMIDGRTEFWIAGKQAEPGHACPQAPKNRFA